MDRRAFLVSTVAGLLGAPRASRAQPGNKLRRIGLLVPGQPPRCGSDAPPAALLALREGLREHGHVEGQSYVLVVRCAVRDGAEIQAAADALVRDGVDLVIVASNDFAHVIQKATSTVPVIFFAVTDPVEEGLVASMAKPGGNITGFSHMTGELAGKRLQLLKELRPRLKRIAILATERHRPTDRECIRLGVDTQWFTAPQPEDIGRAFAAMKQAHVEGLLALPHPMYWLERQRVVTQAAEVGVPAIYENKDFVAAGGLMSYGASLIDLARRAAGYADRILSGVRPADLPVEQPTEFELVINLAPAKALGLRIPSALLVQANQVIE